MFVVFFILFRLKSVSTSFDPPACNRHTQMYTDKQLPLPSAYKARGKLPTSLNGWSRLTFAFKSIILLYKHIEHVYNFFSLVTFSLYRRGRCIISYCDSSTTSNIFPTTYKQQSCWNYTRYVVFIKL